MLNVVIIATATALGGYLAFSRRLAGSSSWKATVTPLASIMGSGFLVSAPLLAGIVGNLAVLCMAALLLLAYGVGGAIRFNIRHFEPIESGRGAALVAWQGASVPGRQLKVPAFAGLAMLCLLVVALGLPAE